MRIVLRIGGSVVASPINAELINRYAHLIVALKNEGHVVFAIVGGGTMAREFIAVGKNLGLEEQAQDEIAISVSRIFAQLFLKKLGGMGCEAVPLTIDEAVRCQKAGKIPIMGGLRPGMTTDTVAALVAENVNADILIKGTDQDGVYNKDPRKYEDAQKVDCMSIDELFTMFSKSKHVAGIHQIVDPEAIKILKRKRMKLIIVNGFKPENILAAVRGERVGTLIE